MFIIKGNLAADPVLKYVGTELEAVVNGTVFSWLGQTMRGEYRNDVPIRFSAWGNQAHHLAENYKKGSRIHLVGEERLEVYNDGDGFERRDITIKIVAILNEESMNTLYGEIRHISRAANEVNFGIPSHVSLGGDAEDMQEDSPPAEETPPDESGTPDTYTGCQNEDVPGAFPPDAGEHCE